MEGNSSNVLSVIAIIISVGGTIIGIINHKRIRSSCCGKKLEASIDIDTTGHSGAVAPALPPIASSPRKSPA